MSDCRSSLRRILPVVLLAFVMGGSGEVAAQTGSISGDVTDATSRQPVSAVQIFIEALNLGTLSQAGGRFVLPTVPAGVHSVTIQRIGYRADTQTVTVVSGETAQLNFEIAQEALALDEVVVTGTAGGTQRRAVGNSVEQLDVTALQGLAPVRTLEQSLGSNVPGLFMSKVGGAPGGDGAQIRIRGSSSQALGNEPIVYIDGVRMFASAGRSSEAQGTRSRLDDINPDDIASIEVIKGPAASTLYGTEASNGVIQIITKRGQVGAPVFNASVSSGTVFLQNPEKYFGSQFGAVPGTGEILGMNILESENRRLGTELFTNGTQASADFQVQGGSDAVRYYGSFGQAHRQGIRDYNTENTTSARTTLSFLPREDLDVRVGLGYTKQDLRDMNQEFYDMYWSSPQLREFEGGVANPLLGFFRVPPQERLQEESTMDRNRTNISVEMNYRPFSWLANRVVFGTDLSTEQEGYLLPRQADGITNPFFGQTGDGRRSLNTNKVQLTTVDYSGTVTVGLPGVPVTAATAFGVQYYDKTERIHTSRGDDFSTAALTTVSAAGVKTSGEDFLQNATVGVFFQEQLDWDQRFFVTGAVRMDDNSAFGANYDAAIYPKLSATWVVSEESFFPQGGLFSTLRIRSAWGVAGQQPDIFASRRLYQPAVGIGSQPILVPQSFGNPDLGPEKGQELEVGFDLALLDGRVTIDHTSYWRTTKDAIVTRQIAPSQGVPGTQLVNVGEIRNWGSETGINVQLLTEDPVRWDIGFSLGIQKNQIEDLGGIQQIPVGRTRYQIEGYPLAGLFGYNILSADFVSGNRGAITNAMCDGGIGPSGHDQGGVAVSCNGAPLVYFGPGEPTWLISFSSTFTLLRDVRLFVNIDGQGGNWAAEDAASACHTTVLCSLMAALKTDPIWAAHVSKRRQGTTQYQAGTIKLRQIGLSYQLPDGLVQRSGADRASLQLGVHDVATLWRQQEWTDFGIRVPEAEGHKPTESFGGEQRHRVPNFMQLSATLRVTF